MNQNLSTETVNTNQTYKVITFPLYIPIIIFILLLIIFVNMFDSTSTEIASQSSSLVYSSSTQIIENNINIGTFNTTTIENLTNIENNQTEENSSNITLNTIENNNTTSTNIVENSVNKSTDIKKEEANKTTEEKNNKKSKTYTASNGEKYTIIGSLSIPSLKIKSNILSSTSEALMKIALNKYWGANPNEVGNMVVVGHNYRGTKFFGKLPNIKIGDIVKITDSDGTTLDYKVYDTFVIDPYDTACTSQLTEGHTEITLITCYNNGKNRFVVKARAK